MGPPPPESLNIWGPSLLRHELSKRILRRRHVEPRPPRLSFGSWDRLSIDDSPVVQLCHPDWRGVRTVAYSFQTPVVECDDLSYWEDELIEGLRAAKVRLVVIQGWPPGSGSFAKRLTELGFGVKCVLHSSPAQHGSEAGEAAVVAEVLSLASEGSLAQVGMAKGGVVEAFQALGHDVTYVPNRVPPLPPVERIDLGPGTHIGVFAEPFWRKNVVTQLLAVALIDDAVAHVMRKPDVAYLDDVPIVEHGELPWDEFVKLQGSVDLNLYVTLSECHPSTPQESYLFGVPCLISRVSHVFREDQRLWEITSTDLLDDPSGIASASRRLMLARDEALTRAGAWMTSHDEKAERIWSSFCGLGPV